MVDDQGMDEVVIFILFLAGGSLEIVYGKMFRRERQETEEILACLLRLPVVGLDMDMMEGGQGRYL